MVQVWSGWDDLWNNRGHFSGDADEVEDCGKFSTQDEEDYFDDIPLDDEDVQAFERFQQKNEEKRTVNLSEVIMAKIKEKQSDLHTKFSDVGSLQIEELDPK